MYFVVKKITSGAYIGDTKDGKVEFVSDADIMDIKRAGVSIFAKEDAYSECINKPSSLSNLGRVYKALEREASVDKLAEMYIKYAIYHLYGNQFSNRSYEPDFKSAKVFDYTQTRGFIVFSIPNKRDNHLLRLFYINNQYRVYVRDVDGAYFAQYPSCSGATAIRMHGLSGESVASVSSNDIYLCMKTVKGVRLIPLTPAPFAGYLVFE